MGKHITRKGDYIQCMFLLRVKTVKILMPTHPNKAGMLIKKGLATPYWSNGIFCIRLNYTTEGKYRQDIVVGVDPGSKKEGFTVKSAKQTYLNVQADAHNKVGKKVEKRRELRRGRRSRKCPKPKEPYEPSCE